MKSKNFLCATDPSQATYLPAQKVTEVDSYTVIAIKKSTSRGDSQMIQLYEVR